MIDRIKKLENSNLTSESSLALMHSVIYKIDKCNGLNMMKVRKKMNDVLNKNSGLKFFQSVNKVINYNIPLLNDPYEFSPTELSCFKYCPMQSCDVERSFSCYKNILRPNRRSFEFENLKQYVTVVCNYEFLF